MKNFRENQKLHKSVLANEVLDALNTQDYALLNKKACFVDATVGLGGHSESFVRKGIFVVGIDADRQTLEIAEEVLSEACPTTFNSREGGCFKLLHGNFSEVDTLVSRVYPENVDGVLFDLGISSLQLDRTERGFSFKDGSSPLDMRLDQKNQSVKASDLLAVLDKRKLTDLFAEVMPTGLSSFIAKAIVKKRNDKPYLTVGDFLETIRPLVRRKGKVDSATLPFLALRIAVNSELENLRKGLEGAFSILSPKGRLAVISFHSGEDRIVKNYFREMSEKEEAFLITKKPVVPGREELADNPRSRSAKMRVLEKI